MRPRDPRVYLTAVIEATDHITSSFHGRNLEGPYSRRVHIGCDAAFCRRTPVLDHRRSAAETGRGYVNEASLISNRRRIIAFRNQLAHCYFAIQHDVVRAVAQNDLPTLAEELRLLLARSHRPS